jgi:hypothetical protein
MASKGHAGSKGGASSAALPKQAPPPAKLLPRPYACDDTTSSASRTSYAILRDSGALRSPPGFLSASDLHRAAAPVSAAVQNTNRAAKVYQSAMAVAKQPGSQLLMTGLMLWMTGNSLQIFSMMTLGMAFWQPVSRILDVNNAFSKYDASNVNLITPKLIWIVLNLVGVAMALYKARSMGLVPSFDELTAAVPTVARPEVYTVHTTL